MALKTVVSAEEFEALDESLQGHYVESQAGGYVLDAEGVDQHPKVQGLRNTLKLYQDVGGKDARRLKAKIEEADRIREQFGDLSPEDARAAIERLAELEKGGEGDNEHQRALQDALAKQAEKINSKWQEKLEAESSEKSEYRAYIEATELGDRLVTSLSGKVLEGTEESVALWLQNKYENRVVWDTIGGKRTPRAVFVNELGEEVPVSTFAESWLRSDAAKPFVPGSGNNGTGAKGDTGGGGRNNPWKPETLNLTEQGRILKENPSLAKQLKSAAGIAA